MSWNANNFFASNLTGSSWWAFEESSGFPTQYPGLRVYYGGTVKELSLVAAVDAPAGGALMIRKSGTTYAAYLVDISDPNASSVRINTPGGVKAIRLRT